MDEHEWQPIATAPRDGTRILARAKNGAGFWMYPETVWWVQNTAVDDPWIQAFWADRYDENGDPVNCYHPPLEWTPLEKV